MAQGYLIHQAGSGLGVHAKIQAQVKALSALGDVRCLPVEMSTAARILNRLPLMGCNLGEVWAQIAEPDFLYIRKWVTDKQTLEFLHRVRTRFPRCLILLEVPTYPYDLEMSSRLKDIPILVKDRRNRRELHKYVDRIVTFYGQSEIFGVPTIMATNGVDVSRIPERVPHSKQAGQIDLIAVATMLPQHGYDRVISGLAEYYRSAPRSRVMLHLVGAGPELRRYRRLCRSEHLDNYVVFHGPQTGRRLDALYDHCDIGLVAFGMHRVGLDRVSALKCGEYLARGLPMAGGCPIDIFENVNFPYYVQFRNDDSPVSILDIVRFHETSRKSSSDFAVARYLRQYAYATLDMPVAMAPVIDYLRRSIADIGCHEV